MRNIEDLGTRSDRMSRLSAATANLRLMFDEAERVQGGLVSVGLTGNADALTEHVEAHAIAFRAYLTQHREALEAVLGNDPDAIAALAINGDD